MLAGHGASERDRRVEQLGPQPQRHLGDDAERALGQPDHVEPGDTLGSWSAGSVCRANSASRDSPPPICAATAARAGMPTIRSAPVTFWPASPANRAGPSIRQASPGRLSALGLPPTIWMVSTCLPDSSWTFVIARRYAGARLSMMQRAIPARPDGAGRPTRRQAAVILAGMSPGARKLGSSGIDDAAQRRGLGCLRQQLPEAGRAVGAGPGAQAFLHQPQAHHVGQVPDSAVDSRFVGEVCPSAGFAEDRLVEFHAHQRPRSARDVGEAAARSGHRRDGRSGVMRADRDDRKPWLQPRIGGSFGQHGPDQVTGDGAAQGRYATGYLSAPSAPRPRSSR